MLQDTKSGSINNKNSSFLVIAIFTISLFMSASLMFAVQPMIGKMLLPLAGGTPASWIVAMAFFQIALLVGYMLAWIMSRFEVRTHTLILVVLLGLGFTILPVKTANFAYILDNQGISPFSIFTILLLSIGLPFTALSTVSSTLQRLFTATDHHSSHDPYFLYAASNGGSLLGLLSYPIIIEPLFPLSMQTSYWQFLYGGLIVMCLLCLALTHVSQKSKTTENNTKSVAEDISWKNRVEWLLLAFFPSSLLMGTTSYVTTDIISVPLLWVLPLGLYLLTHIFAFSKKRFFKDSTLYMIHPIAVCMIFLISIDFAGFHIFNGAWNGAVIIILSFFMIALALHTRLASIRPHNKYLTQFYFFLALGGAIGGSFNAFIAPVIFDSVLELPIIVLLSCLVNPYLNTDSTKSEVILLVSGIFILITCSIVFASTQNIVLSLDFNLLQAVSLLIAISLICGSNAKITLYGLSAYMFLFVFFIEPNNLLAHRNFFGVSRVYDEIYVHDETQEETNVRYFTHGTTVHGAQNLDASVKEAPITSYYGPLRGVIDTYKPKHVALMGLGAGVIRCYHAPDRYYTMYEIDPDVVDIAKKYFDFIDDCGSEKDNIVIGDGRLEMAKRNDDIYDLIILDAFTSDSVPTHLLTKEAFIMYKEHLTKDGLIAMNISNRYINLKKVIAATAKEINFKNLSKHRTKVPALEFSSEWIVIAPENFDLSALEKDGWKTVPDEDITNSFWTDEYTNILSILKF